MENLFKCLDCGKEVSQNAKVCPSCGNNKIKNQIAQQKWNQMDPNKKKIVTVLGITIFILFILVIVFGDKKPSACDCIKNINIGYYDALNEKDRKIRDQCLDEYPGDATLYIECKKEKGKWK